MSSNKNFGLLFSIIFFILGWYFIHGKQLHAGTTFFVLGVVFCLVSLIKPNKLTILNYCWMRLGFFLGKLVNPIVITLVFAVVFVPVGLFFRMIGRDQLKVRDAKLKTLWCKRTKDQTDFKNQF